MISGYLYIYGCAVVTVWHPALCPTIKYYWYVDILPSCRRVSHSSSIDSAKQVSFMVVVTGGCLLCVTHCPVESCSVTVSHPALMWTLHTLSSSHHTHIGQRRQTTFFRDCVTMTVTKMALHWHLEFKWQQIDNAVDIDENTKQVLTYDKYDMCKATLTTDGENMPVMASGGACYPCL